MGIIKAIYFLVRAFFVCRLSLAAENLALRQQVAVYKQSVNNVTDHPYAKWAAQQIIDAFPYDEAPRFLIRDRDGIYGEYFKKRGGDMGIEEPIRRS
jgi:hypothetical protein